MWINYLIGFILWVGFCFVVFSLIQKLKHKKLIRRYDEEKDFGRRFPTDKGNFGGGARGGIEPGKLDITNETFSEGEPELQDIVEHAKREFLPSRIAGLNHEY